MRSGALGRLTRKEGGREGGRNTDEVGDCEEFKKGGEGVYGGENDKDGCKEEKIEIKKRN